MRESQDEPEEGERKLFGMLDMLLLSLTKTHTPAAVIGSPGQFVDKSKGLNCDLRTQ